MLNTQIDLINFLPPLDVKEGRRSDNGGITFLTAILYTFFEQLEPIWIGPAKPRGSIPLWVGWGAATHICIM
jgi:hypothetical protein